MANTSTSERLPTVDLHRGSAQDLLWWLISGYLLMIVVCSGWLRAGGVMAEGQTLTYDRALFLSVSTATLTGFQQTIGPNDFNGSQGPVILIVLTIAGSLMAMIIGGLAAVRVLRMPFSDRHIIGGALTVEVLTVLAGTAALFTARADLVDAVLQSACAFGNSGAVITAKTTSLLGPPQNRFPSYMAWQSQCILLPLSIIGGLGLPVVMELYERMLGGTRRLSLHSRTVIGLTAGTYLVATLMLFVGAMMHREMVGGSARIAFLAASTTAINARTAGLPFEDVNVFSRPFQWLIVLLMILGASPAGTAGGLKATTFWHLFPGVRDILQGRPVSRSVGIAAVWLGGYMVMAIAGFLMLSAISSQIPADQVGFLTISALSNVGLSHDPVSITGNGLFVLDLIMLAGRLAPLGILWWMASTTGDSEVLVG